MGRGVSTGRRVSAKHLLGLILLRHNFFGARIVAALLPQQ
jgi:hypothetical protein